MELKIKELAKEVGFDIPDLSQKFYISDWPSWLNFSMSIGKRGHSTVQRNDIGWETRESVAQNLTFFISNDGSFGFYWEFVFYHMGSEIGTVMYHSGDQEESKRLTALLFFLRHRSEILMAVREKMERARPANNLVARQYREATQQLRL